MRYETTRRAGAACVGSKNGHAPGGAGQCGAMKHYVQWSALFASYFAIMGLWMAFGPATLMAVNPQAAPLALALMTLAYFVASPLALRVWRGLGFAGAVRAMGGCVVLFLCLAALQPQWLVWCAPLAFVCGSGTYIVCETRLLEDLARTGQGHAFGRARKWGSLGFLLAASAAGAAFSVGGVARNFALALALCALVYGGCCLALARAVGRAAAAHTTPVASGTAHAPAHAAAALPAEPMRMDTRSNKALGCAAVASMRVAEALSSAWFGAYWLHTGHSPWETGLLCALPVAAEFVAMWKGGPWVARFSAAALMLVCCLVSAVRWAATPLCSELWCAVPLQGLHAFTFGIFYPASLLWLRQRLGDDFFQTRYATESAARALTAAITFAAASWAIAAYGYAAIFGVSAVLALLSGMWWWAVARAVARA